MRGTNRAVLHLLILALILAVPLFFNTWSPYHTDSAGFSLAARHHTFRGFGWRWGTELVYYLLGWIFGDRAHAVFVLLSVAVFVFGAYLFFRRHAGHPFLLTAVVLSAPASVMTLAIGKEDLFALGVALLSLGAVGTNPLFSLLSGTLFAYSVACKETAVLLAPLFVPFILRACRGRDWKNLLAFLAGGAVLAVPATGYIVEVLASGNPGMGMFYGFFSPIQPVGMSMLLEGLGPMAVLFLTVLCSPFLPKDRRHIPVFAVLYAGAVFLYLSNVSVVSYRHALWIMPALALSVSPVLKDSRMGRPARYVLALLALSSALALVPNLEIKRLNLPARFASAVGQYTEENALILAMDHCALVEFYGRRHCRTHPPYLFFDENVWVEVEYLSNLNVPLYVYPDYFAYDRNGMFRRAFMQRFRLEPVYSGWYEDYHAVRIYGGEEKLRNLLSSRGLPSCPLLSAHEGRGDIYGLPVRMVRYYLDCGRVVYDIGVVPVYRGLVLFGVGRATLYRAHPA